MNPQMTPIKINEINKSVPDLDLFISAVSFEQRAFTLLDSITQSKVKKIWFCFNENEGEFYSDNMDKATQYSNHNFLKFSTDDPLITAQTLAEKFNEPGTFKNVLLDVTTFTHEGLLIVYKFLDLFKEKIENLYIGYVGAKEYSINESSDDDKWLSKGTKTIRSVLGYPGILNPSKKNHLIILFGFESERVSKLIENFEFDKVSVGLGPEYDSILPNHYTINRKRHLEILKQYPFAETFEFSLKDPFSTKAQIEQQINKFNDYNVVIAPLNNKLSTIGVAMVALENIKVQICYVRAHEYNYKGYSTPSEECYVMKVI